MEDYMEGDANPEPDKEGFRKDLNPINPKS